MRQEEREERRMENEDRTQDRKGMIQMIAAITGSILVVEAIVAVLIATPFLNPIKF